MFIGGTLSENNGEIFVMFSLQNAANRHVKVNKDIWITCIFNYLR